MTDKVYLISECTSGSIEVLDDVNESIENRKSGLRFRGKFQEADEINKNKRFYGRNILDREVNRLAECIGERRLFGELDHPTNSIIHLENASHLITKLFWEGNKLMGEGEMLLTPAGMILESIIRSGIPVGISSRGVGTGRTRKDGVMVIDENFKLITFDVVADPSTYKAFAEPVAENAKDADKLRTPKNLQKIEHSSVNNTNENINHTILIGFLKGAFNQALENK